MIFERGAHRFILHLALQMTRQILSQPTWASLWLHFSRRIRKAGALDGDKAMLMGTHLPFQGPSWAVLSTSVCPAPCLALNKDAPDSLVCFGLSAPHAHL